MRLRLDDHTACLLQDEVPKLLHKLQYKNGAILSMQST